MTHEIDFSKFFDKKRRPATPKEIFDTIHQTPLRDVEPNLRPTDNDIILKEEALRRRHHSHKDHGH